jgi:hypothetical protein
VEKLAIVCFVPPMTAVSQSITFAGHADVLAIITSPLAIWLQRSNVSDRSKLTAGPRDRISRRLQFLMRLGARGMSKAKRPVVRLFSALVAVAVQSLLVQSVSADDAIIKRLSANIRSNEQLYHNIDVEYDEDYSCSEPLPALARGLKRYHVQGRQVSQGQFYLSRKTLSQYYVNNDVPQTHEMFTGFDGKVTRVLAGNIGNIRQGQVGGFAPFSPHSFIFEPANIRIAFASFVMGGKAVADDPFAGPMKTDVVRTTLLGVEIMDGRPMDKVKIENLSADSKSLPDYYYHIWLDRERNYLPYKAEGYRKWSEKLPAKPSAIYTIQDVRQIADGVWMPHKITIIGYDQEALFTSDKQVVRTQMERKVTKVQLSPKHDLSLFSNVVFPKGTSMYEMNGDIILRRYVKGEESKPEEKTKNSSIPYFVFGGGCVTLIACLATVSMRRRNAKLNGHHVFGRVISNSGRGS